MTHQLMTQSQQSTASAAAWDMPPGEALRLPIGPGTRELLVMQGRLWLTQTGTAGADDVWLQAGDSITLASGSEWVAEGWGATRFQLLVPPSACAAASRLSGRGASARRSSASPGQPVSSSLPALG